MKSIGKQKKDLLMMLDANFNRCREGLRVCEDIGRFVWRSQHLSRRVRHIRHEVSLVLKSLPYSELLAARDAAGDVGKDFHRGERKRDSWKDFHTANIQRAKESLRVLEEVMKLVDSKKSRRLKRLRFDVYEYEKKCTQVF